MKIRYLLLILLSISFLFITACGNEEEKDTLEVPQIIEVVIQTEPEENLQPNESFIISAKVTQGDEYVNDADEVTFEIWKKGQADDEHEKIEAEFQENGIYSIEKIVEEPGIYYVISHVTAREMHTMPQKELKIGNVESQTEAEDVGHTDGEDHDAHEQAGHPSSGVTLHIMVDDPVENSEQIELIGHIQNGDEPVSNASVEFEIWQGTSEKHEFIPTTEEALGEYKANYTFSETGEYHIKLHFKKDDLHDHKETIITVE